MPEPSPRRTAILRPCLGCGIPVETEKQNAGARCLACTEEHSKQFPRFRDESNKESSARRGYGYAWRRLSAQARREHPWCMDCGTPDDLTADHLRWPARTLADVEVVCRSCNSSRGALRRSGKPIVEREPLHGYASAIEDRGGNPVGGVLDPQGGARVSVTLSDPSGACMDMQGDRS